MAGESEHTYLYQIHLHMCMYVTEYVCTYV